VTYNQQRAAGRTPAQAYYMPTAADACVMGFRQWVDQFGGGGPFGLVNEGYLTRLAPRQSKQALLDR
jgi:hypothetical protein